MQINFSSLIVGLIFCPLAAVAAFLITYSEYSHHYPDKKMPLKLATEAAISAFVVFAAISLLVALVMNLLLQ